MPKRKLTEKDFKENPDLFYKHHKVIGDEYDFPDDTKENSEQKGNLYKGKKNPKPAGVETSSTDDPTDDGRGGNHPNNPGGKP